MRRKRKIKNTKIGIKAWGFGKEQQYFPTLNEAITDLKKLGEKDCVINILSLAVLIEELLKKIDKP